MVSASATTVKILHSRQVRYKNDKSVETAINELYEKAERCYDEDGIPLTYTKLEYLESTGTQYIDTGYSFVDKMRFIFKSKWLIFPDNKRKGSMFGANSGAYEVLLGYNSSNINYLGGSFTYEWNNQIDYKIDLDLKNTSGQLKLTVNDEVIRNVSSHVNEKKCYLFGTIGSSSDTSITYMATERFYYFKIYYENDLVRDFVPVLDSKSRPCLFDKVEKKCYYNQGTGEFLYG